MQSINMLVLAWPMVVANGGVLTVACVIPCTNGSSVVHHPGSVAR